MRSPSLCGQGGNPGGQARAAGRLGWAAGQGAARDHLLWCRLEQGAGEDRQEGGRGSFARVGMVSPGVVWEREGKTSFSLRSLGTALSQAV